MDRGLDVRGYGSDVYGVQMHEVNGIDVARVLQLAVVVGNGCQVKILFRLPSVDDNDCYKMYEL